MINRKRQPTHPGAILREDILPAAKITQTDLALALGVSRRTVNQIVHEQRPVTPDMALRLARVFETTPEFWLNLQLAVEIWKAEKEHYTVYRQITPLAASA